jgi:hypothetical protein
VHQGLKLKATNVQRQPRGVSRPLPDAPSARFLSPGDTFQRAADQVGLPLLASPPEMNASAVRETQPGAVLPEAPSVTALYTKDPAQNKADAFLAKYLYPPPLKQNSHYQPSSSDNLMGRATDAASRMFVTRDESGKRKLNTPYFLRVLTSVAANNASRRYRARSGSAPLSDFGSTVGNDAGMNLLREFGPGIRQVLTSHMPGFGFRTQEHANREPSPRPARSIPGR